LIQVVILCGGLGSRLGSSEPDLPKALHVISGKTILEWQVRNLESGEFKILLLVGEEKNVSKFSVIAKTLESKYGNKITLLAEKSRLGTAGSLRNAQDKLSRKFIVLMGDVLFDEQVSRIYKTLDRRTSFATWVRETDHPQDSDLVKLSATSSISQFLKYPHEKETDLELVYGLTGVFAMKRKFLKTIPKGEFLDISVHLNTLGTHQLKYCRGVISLNSFRDVGTKDRFAQAEEFIKEIDKKTQCTLVVLDRDDTLMLDPNRVSQKVITYNKKIVRSLSGLQSKYQNVKFLIATNQPGIAKAQSTDAEVRQINRDLEIWLNGNGIRISDIRFCPHHPMKGFEGEIEKFKIVCKCRKPSPGMVTDFVKENHLNPLEVVVFGDSKFDYLLSRSLACRFVWVRFGKIHVSLLKGMSILLSRLR
jgi:mannose-1-phosphate guanylyltransferase/phosphomannomutase